MVQNNTNRRLYYGIVYLCTCVFFVYFFTFIVSRSCWNCVLIMLCYINFRIECLPLSDVGSNQVMSGKQRTFYIKHSVCSNILSALCYEYMYSSHFKWSQCIWQPKRTSTRIEFEYLFTIFHSANNCCLLTTCLNSRISNVPAHTKRTCIPNTDTHLYS